jgi:Cu2+-exporting ATPase
MTYAVSLYAGAMQGMAPNLAQLLRFVSLIVATPVVLYAAQPFFIAAARSIRARTLGMDVPVALSIGAAYLWSVCSTLRGRGAVYFDSAVMFTFFLLLGRYIEISLRHRCSLQHDALVRLLPSSALRVAGAQLERVTPDELIAGDRVRIVAGERIAADGEIIEGITDVDESLLTGESAPRSRRPGDTLIAGTLNLSGAVEMRVSRVGQDSTLAGVSRLLERARAERPALVDLADRVAAWFVGGVLLLALGVVLYWLHVDASRAFPTMLAVLVVTCPCALSLATPAALAAATTCLARSGVLVVRSRALERLARTDCVVFDKTGTLTRGQPRVDEVRVLSARFDRTRCVAIAAALERYSEHPIARAFSQFEPAACASQVRSLAGRGIEGDVGDVRYRLGRADYVLEMCGGPAASFAAKGTYTSAVLGDSYGLLAEFVLTDGLREDAAQATRDLRALGVQVHIASGDRAAVVAWVARRLDIRSAYGDMRAQQKLQFARTLQSQGHGVTMVGDGVNDAPVLAGADVSVAIASGTDLAKISADLVLMGERLSPLVRGIESARRTRHIIQQNLAWAALYNLTAVPLAACGWLQPWMAAIGMSASSLLVVLNAMRLLAPRARAPAMTASAAPAALTI